VEDDAGPVQDPREGPHVAIEGSFCTGDYRIEVRVSEQVGARPCSSDQIPNLVEDPPQVVGHHSSSVAPAGIRERIQGQKPV
jgi:hypothetical protein